MAVVGTAEVEVHAKTDAFERQVRSGIVGKFTGAVGAAETKLKSFGITTQDVAVVLGAGLAGGAAFAAREVLRFGAASVKAAADLGEARNLVEVTFGASADIVERFAQRSATAFGLSERAALQAAGSFGTIGEAAGLSDRASARFGVTLSKIAADLASLRNITPEEALQRLQSGLVGETESLRRLGVIIDQDTLKRAAQREGIIEGSRELTQQEKILATYAEILRQTDAAQGDFARTSGSLPNQLRTLTAQVEDLKAQLGEALIPVVSETVGVFSDLIFVIDKVGEVANKVGAPIDRLLELLGRKPEEGKGFFDSILGNLPFFREGRALDFISNLLGKEQELGDENEELATTQDLITDGWERQAEATDKAEKAAQRLLDAQIRLERARQDAERNEFRARRDLDRVLEDAELREDEAERDRLEAIQDAAEQRKDAERGVTEDKIAAFRDVRKARERLADFERDAARRVADAEERILDLRREQQRAITSAMLDLQAAQRAGNAEAENRARIALEEARSSEDIRDAERDLAQERADRARELKLLERDLAEARIDARKRVEDAQRQLERAIREGNKRIEEAERRLADVRRRNDRAVIDAQERLDDAVRQGRRSVNDARRALERMDDEVLELTADVKALNKELDKLNDQMSDLGSQGGLIGEDIIGVGGFQHGGAARRGQLAIVGEAGPELVRFGGDAHVFPNSQLMSWLLAWLRRGGGPHPLPTGPSPGQLNITNNVFEAADARLTAALVSRYVARQVG